MELVSTTVRNIEVEDGTGGILLSQDDENILMSQEQLAQFLNVYESQKLSAIIKAGEKMAEALRHNKRVVDLGNPNNSWAFIDEDAEALTEWEAANK